MKLEGKKVPWHVWWHFRGRWLFFWSVHIIALVTSLLALGFNIYVSEVLK